MTLQQALSLNVNTANYQQLQQANKIMTRALNRQLLGFKYGSTKNVDTTQAAFYQDFKEAHGGSDQFKLPQKKSFKRRSVNELKAHVNDAQKWLSRKDSSVRKWKANLNSIFDDKSKYKRIDQKFKKQYKKWSIDEKNLFWKWYSKSQQKITYEDSDTLVKVINVMLSNPQNLRDDASTLKLIEESYQELQDEKRKKVGISFKRGK